MSQIRPASYLASMLLVTSVLAGCNGSESSPFAPSTGDPSGGATVQGLVNPSGSRTASSASFAAATAGVGTVTVTVVGTDLIVEVSAGGQFTITNVPPGIVQLLFDGPSGRATLDIGPVGPNQVVELVVILDGNTATLESTSSHDDSSDDDSDDVDDDDSADDDSEDDDSEDDDSEDDDSEDDDSTDDDSDDDDSDDDDN